MSPALFSPDGAGPWLLAALVLTIAFYVFSERRYSRRIADARRDLDERAVERDSRGGWQVVSQEREAQASLRPRSSNVVHLGSSARPVDVDDDYRPAA